MTRYLSLRDIDWTLFCHRSGHQRRRESCRFTAPPSDTAVHAAWWRQLVYVVGGLVLMWMMLAVDYHTIVQPRSAALHRVRIPAAGDLSVSEWRCSGRGAGFRWAADSTIQVSEFVKLVIILLVARYLTELRSDDLDIREMLKLAGLVMIPAGLVLKQPDLGTSLTYFAVLVVGAFLAGLNWKYVATIAVVAVLVLPIRRTFPEGLPEVAIGQLHGSRSGSARRRLPVDSVADRDRLRRDDR